MTITMQVTRELFHQEFLDSRHAETFTEEARDALFDHLEDIERSTGSGIELDIEEIASTYSEFTVRQFNNGERCEYEDKDEVFSDYYCIDIPDTDRFIFEHLA